ncbi:MAG: tRNA guanosine(34) transglycosylase Tgt [Thermoplasmata archaeon]|nr:MAG: tRNA guanosine(34) transglycosylase Tgt [Thermoplasmata archaeon]
MFKVTAEDGKIEARCGELKLGHGVLNTPSFLPVATKADVKMTSPDELRHMGAQGVIVNAFLLYLRPGAEVIEAAGGVHGFMDWDGTVFSDSGGFQILNKEFLVKVADEHVTFRSPYDGDKYDFTPEKCAEVQMTLNTDVALALDDCPRFGSDHENAEASTSRTIRWARRFKEAHDSQPQASFGIIQGGVYRDLREKCTEALVDMEFDGYAIGGLSIGEPKELMHEVVGWSMPHIPSEKPRYLMGVGSPEDMLRAISMGVDIFDSVFPTRNARHNTVYTRHGKKNLGKEKYSRDFTPIERECQCYTCRHFSLAYVNHLLREYEFLGMRLATLHNLHFTINLMKEAREAIENGRFTAFKNAFLKDYLG